MAEINNKGQEKRKTAVRKEKELEIPRSVSVRELSELLDISGIEIIKQLMRNGVLVNINQVIDYEVASLIVKAYGYTAKPQPHSMKSVAADIKKQVSEAKRKSDLSLRPPVVTIMGHVDHGKTRLLDALRQTNVMDAEVGGITQHIGAYQITASGKKITFLDTPGHEAFTAMRARGAQVTDITILVVAADDGVMPQTLEAIDHAKAAGVPILIAINKIDKEGVNPDKVKQQLADVGLVVEEWGGDVIAVPTSAKEGKGISEILDNILLLAEMEDLRANPDKHGIGVVIEANMDKTKGPMATVLVQDGTVKIGDSVAVGTAWGRVKAMFNDAGKRIKKAEPSTPVAILGLSDVPQVGDALKVASNEKQARLIAERRKEKIKEESKPATINLNNLYDQIATGEVKELKIVLKVDVQGSIEPIKNSLEKLSTEKVQIRIIRSAAGNISESDIMLAVASKALVIGFGAEVDAGAVRLAEADGVDIRRYNIIYKLIEDVERAMKGMLEPTYVEVFDGRAQVRATFASGKYIVIAGVMVSEGKIKRSSIVKVIRGEEVLTESEVLGLRRFKDDVSEVAAGYECGVTVKNFNKFEVGDVLEFYHREKAQ